MQACIGHCCSCFHRSGPTEQAESKSKLLNASRENRDFFTPTEGGFAGWTYRAVLVECEEAQAYEAIYIGLQFMQYCE
jgi:hypothetical protein